tara:strand:+ start:204 stop:2015 length:1812 start_codon:yes stop_codon:yes gene_type:complete
MFISIFIGFSLIYFISNFIFKKINFENLFITLFCIVSPIPFLAYTQAIYIKFYLYGLFFFTLFLILFNLNLFIKRKKFKKTYLINKIKLFFNNIISKRLILILSFLITLALTYKTLPNIWRFEAHDLLYYSWLNEIFESNYNGPIRIPTAYPNIFSANHLISGSLLSPFLLFNNNVNMFDSYSIKCLLYFSSLFNFIFVYLNSFYKEFKPSIFFNKIFPVFVVFSLFLFYSSELDYSASISNFPLILIVLTFSAFLLKQNNRPTKDNEKEFNLIIIFLAYSLLISKATTFPIVFISYIIFIFYTNFKKLKVFFNEINKSYLIILFIFILINFLSWVIPESNHGTLQASSPLCLLNSDNPKQLLKCTYFFFKNPFVGWYIPSLKTNFLNSDSLGLITEFYFIWIICLLPCFISGILLNKYSNLQMNQLYGKYITSYALATSFGVVFIRESMSYTGSHTFHSTVIAPIFTITALIILYRENHKKIYINTSTNLLLKGLLFLLLIINFYDNSILSMRIKPFKNQTNIVNPSIVTLTNYESNQFTSSGCTENKKLIKYFGNYLDINGCAHKENNIPEIQAALKGMRTNASLESKYSKIKQWVLNKKN